jgi:AcrR family transcriptional regulator
MAEERSAEDRARGRNRHERNRTHDRHARESRRERGREQRQDGERGRDAEAARQALLDAAELIFARDGFSGARLDDIAVEAGYNKALIFRYIGDKQDLYHAAVRRCLTEVGAFMGELLAPFVDDASAALDARRVRAFIERAAGWLFDFYVAHPNHRRILIWEAAEGFEIFSHWPLTQDNVPWRDASMELLERARAGGILRADVDPVALITNVMGMALIYLASLPRYSKLFPGQDFLSPEALAHAREQMVTLVVNGVMAHPAAAVQDATKHTTEEETHAAGV